MLEDTATAVGLQYVVTVDGHKLGTFASCEGLGLEVVVESREEGGFNTGVWQLPTRVKYPNVKLTRPLGKETADVMAWLSTVSQGLVATTASIEARTTDGTTVVRWTLQGVVPIRWTGPSLTPDTTKVVTETLELAHHGFGKGA
ncbi:phage tail protein [Cellulomonas sp. H30R-01]|uniref:Phage tail protein n=2 Tax=Cellulomonas TaxID=1707 RepID=A0A401V065_9CELL|nr:MULTISPECIES: phage tail protein [Cellulomonas]NKY41602.1 phage tail protein [Cellulomonas septica]QHT57648.1 phage tail protein [Cellulomonas sp. H30R-01]GCD20337.1 phage tail protein [Cellulomonas algicola]